VLYRFHQKPDGRFSDLNQDTEPPHLSHLLHSHLLPALQLHTLPKSSIDIYLLVLQSESPSIESVLASGLTVCAAAVADAGIAMNGLAVGTVTSLSGTDADSATNSKRIIQLDPDGLQARAADARVTVGCLPALDALSDVWVTGEVTVDNLISVSPSRRSRRLQKYSSTDDVAIDNYR